MGFPAAQIRWIRTHPSVSYITPFACLLLLRSISSSAERSLIWQSAAFAIVLSVVIWLCWPPGTSLKLTDPSGSALLGIAVFLVWIAPDIVSPDYRTMPLFHNKIVGHLHSSLSPRAIHNGWILFWRSFSAVLLVVAEELFWRGWLMRRLISRQFRDIPVGRYAPIAFWSVAVLFAAAQGPYWDVGLVAGVIFNWWAIRSGSLADLIWMHAVANACLSAYVIGSGAWQYWR